MSTTRSAPSQVVPTRVTAQLTLNGTAGATLTTHTSRPVAGDVQRVALQANATGRCPYSITIAAVRGATTNSIIAGAANVVNNAGSALGTGWTVVGLERIVPAAGGVMLDLGRSGRSLWFAAGAGSTIVNLVGEFSTLVANAGGTYTRRHTNGKKVQYDAPGREVSQLDTNGLGMTYAYMTVGAIYTVTDNYGKVTTCNSGGGLLDSITDPDSRSFSFAHSETRPTGVTLPDTSTWGYGQDTAGRMTGVTTPAAKSRGWSMMPPVGSARTTTPTRPPGRSSRHRSRARPPPAPASPPSPPLPCSWPRSAPRRPTPRPRDQAPARLAGARPGHRRRRRPGQHRQHRPRWQWPPDDRWRPAQSVHAADLRRPGQPHRDDSPRRLDHLRHLFNWVQPAVRSEDFVI